ncbi:MAG: hypothetical protein F4057_04225 [Acidobacteria bacterium]|nr:hypothetical protein [Acidobacteriota bacterium]
MEAGRRQRAPGAGLLPGQPREGRGGPGHPEPQRSVRPGRAGGVALKNSLHVIKFGGELLDEPRQRRRIARAVCAAAATRRVVVVHGGGREVDAELARSGIPKRTVDGVRITDAATLDIVLGVLAGRVNTRLVAAIGAAGASAVGLTGVDAGMAIVKPARSYRATDGNSVDLGFVGLPGRARRLPELQAS